MIKQQGYVLLLTMVFLTLTAWITLSVLENGLFLSRLFSQQQQKADDLLHAENYLNAVLLENKNALQIKRFFGYRSCALHLDKACNDNALQLSLSIPKTAQLFYYMDYQGDDAERSYWQVNLFYQHSTQVELELDISVAFEDQVSSSHFSNPQGEWRFY